MKLTEVSTFVAEVGKHHSARKVDEGCNSASRIVVRVRIRIFLEETEIATGA